MITYFKHCSHCGITYLYQASGDGCLNELNDKDYCPTCKKAIIDALNTIPVKYIEKWKLVSNIDYNDLELLKENNENKFKISKLVGLNNSNNNCVEQFFKDNKLYQVEWNTSNPSIKEIYCMYPYNTIEKQFSNEAWIYDNEKTRFVDCCYFNFKEFGKNIKAKPLNEPNGDLYYGEWDVIFKN